MQLSAEPIRRVVIVGGGTSGWMCAAGLSRMLDRRQVSVTLIESEEIGTIGVGEATIPTLQTFNGLLGVDEAEFMQETRATVKLGIEFTDWGGLGESYIHPFGIYGLDRPEVKFHQMWLRLRQAGFDVGDIGEYNLSHVAARLNRFGLGTGRGALPGLRYAYHLDASLYARYLRRYAEARGVSRTEGMVAAINRRDDGFVSSLTLKDGEIVDGDLFVDCTGFRGLLIGQNLGVTFEDWTHWLPCDRAVAQPCESSGPLVPYTRSMADKAGWRWRIPLQHRVGNGYVYSSAHISDDAAVARLADTLGGRPLADPLLIRFKAGCRRSLWERNVVAIGLAGGFIEPLESTSIHLMKVAVTRLIQDFPFNGCHEALIDHFNDKSRREFEGIRDFIILHYHITERDDSPFWNRCRTMEIPDSLKERIEIFREDARAYQTQHDLFRVDSWAQVLPGQRLNPQGYHRLAAMMPYDELRQSLADLRKTIADKVAKLPSHPDFLRSYCPAEAP